MSCQNDENLYLEILKEEYRKPEIKAKFKEIGQYGAQEVDKSGLIAYFVNHSPDDIINQSAKETQRILDVLVFKKLAKVSFYGEKTYHYRGELMNGKKFNVEITDEGKKYLVGETSEKWVLNVFDFDDFQYVQKPEKNGDAIVVKYKIGKIIKTKAYECLNPQFQKGPTYLINEKAITAKLVNINGKLTVYALN